MAILEKKHSSRLHALLSALIIFLLIYAAAFISSIFRTDAWYENLKKPMFTPPDILFPISWNVLLFFIAISIILLWKYPLERAHITLLFGIILLLTILWNIFFFGLHNPQIAFFEMLLLVVSVLGTGIYAYSLRKSASLFLLPYTFWIIYLAYWNYQIAFIL